MVISSSDSVLLEGRLNSFSYILKLCKAICPPKYSITLFKKIYTYRVLVTFVMNNKISIIVTHSPITLKCGAYL